MTSRLTLGLVIAAALSDSFLAGLNINRALVEMPAWQQTGPLGWAAFSRHADLALNAAILYPGAAFAGLLLSVAAIISFHRDRTAPRRAIVPLYAAAVLAAAGLLMTLKAAPYMLSVPSLDNDAAALQQALDGFQFWGGIRGVFQVSAFVANFWSLVALLMPSTGPEPR